MALIQSNYAGVRDYLQPADLIAFGGAGLFSDVIKAVTLSSVSHVGIVLTSKLLLDGPQPGKIVDIIESTTLNGKSGVQRNRMSDRVEDYNGDIWWLSLRDDVRRELDQKAYFDYCLNQVGHRYNWIGAVLAGLHLPQYNFTHAEFCSEVAVACMKAGGVSELEHVDPPCVSPEELCAMNLFAKDYVQIKGTPKEIRAYNTRPAWMANL